MKQLELLCARHKAETVCRFEYGEQYRDCQVCLRDEGSQRTILYAALRWRLENCRDCRCAGDPELIDMTHSPLCEQCEKDWALLKWMRDDKLCTATVVANKLDTLNTALRRIRDQDDMTGTWARDVALAALKE